MSHDLPAAQPDRSARVRDFTASELFDRTFREGMELVEAAATYLDGPGRQQSKLLSRNAALAYAGESMRLTTRLMQVASWLLVQRAVREGDMTPSEACDPRYRVASKAPPTTPPAGLDELGLPQGLTELAERSERLFERIRRLDEKVYESANADLTAHPVLSQFERLRTAFNGGEG